MYPKFRFYAGFVWTLIAVPTMAIVGACQKHQEALDEPPRIVSQDLNRGLDSRDVSLRLANLFHHKFVTSCMPHIPAELHVQYLGHLGTDSGRLGQRLNDPEMPSFLDWDVHSGIVLFTFRVSTTETKETLVKCRVDDKDLFVSVPFVDENRSVDAKLPELGERSVREVLQYLESESKP